MRPSRRPQASVRAAAVAVAVAVAAAASAEAVMVVPGGTEGVARLLGNVDRDPDRFASSLNRVLLEVVRSDHDPESVEARRVLRAYLATVQEIDATLDLPLEIDPASPGSVAAVARVAGVLGFRLLEPTFPLKLEAPGGDEAALRRRAALAVGWNLLDAADRLNRGEIVRLGLRHDRVEPLLPLPLWSALTGRQVHPENALLHMAGDQRLGMIVEGMARLTRETREALDEQDVRWLYDRAAIPFFRYAASLELRGGAWRTPGGPQAAPVWERLVGESPDRWRPFLRRLLLANGSRPAYLWGALHWLPEERAAWYLEHIASGPGDGKRLARFFKAMNRLRGAGYFASARGDGAGLSLFCLAVPGDEADAGPSFPGSPALWLESLDGRDGHLGPETTTRMVERALEDPMTRDECVARLLTRTTTIGGFQGLLVQQLVRTAHVLRQRPELATPENIALANVLAARHPAAVDVLGRFRFGDADSVRAYLLAVARLGELDATPENEVVLVLFQGGVELLASISEVDRVPREHVREALDAWIAAFEDTASVQAVGSRVSGWLVGFLDRLPAPAGDYPGRGPLERAMLAALVDADDPQRFSWGELDYGGHRGRDQAARMARRLERDGIPSPSAPDALRTVLRDLDRACLAGDRNEARRLAREGLFVLGERPSAVKGTGSALSAFSGSLPGRDALVEVLTEVLEEDRADRLPIVSAGLGRAAAGVLEPLVSVIVAPAYLRSASRIDNVVLASHRLIPRHTLFDRPGGGPSPGTVAGSAWGDVLVIPSSRSETGARMVGALGRVGPALADLHVQTLHSGATARAGVPTRQRRWTEDLVRPSWTGIPDDALAFVASAVDLGSAVIERSLAEPGGAGSFVDWVARRVPRYRLERGGEVSPSERFALGLAAVRGDAYGPPPAELAGSRRVRALAAESASIDPASLDAVGAPTPALNGRRHAWVGTWPPYESLEREAGAAALAERELLDVRVAIAAFLGRHRLPAALGADLMHLVLEEVPSVLRPEGERDWEAVVAWTGSLDDAYFSEKVRTCLIEGWYFLSDS